jgi:CelD/BcsL family acetyltransferase involved in cellulose biosynthesis
LPSFEGLQRDWDALAESARNVFLTWDWAATWWRHFGGSRTLLLRAWRAPSGEVAGILPLSVRDRSLLREIRFVGSGISQQLGPLCAPRDRAAAAHALASVLDESGGRRDVLVAEDLPAEDGWAEALGGVRLRTTPSPRLRADASGWSAFLASRSPNFRRQLVRQRKRLANTYDLRFRLAEDRERLDRDLDVLFSLHRSRWGARFTPFAAAEGFHREIARRAQERGRLRLWVLELDRRPAAALYGFRFADVEWFFQSGRDARLESYSPGFVLLGHAVREALGAGVRECAFLRGDDPYKLRFSTEERSLETIALGRGLAGRAALLCARIARPLPPRTRRALARSTSGRG